MLHVRLHPIFLALCMTRAARDKLAESRCLPVQECLRRVIKGVGGFSHAEWRAFHNEHTELDCKNFVDGDLIEQFLDLKRDSMDRIATVRLACLLLSLPLGGDPLCCNHQQG